MTEAIHSVQLSDIVIPVIGSTGAGKSTFINYLLAGAKSKQRVKVSNDYELSGCTKNIEAVVIDCNRYVESQRFNRRIVILDTPGLDDDDIFTNLEVMGRIVKWLKAS
ncbi:hypothetical protein EST38_g8599 [Candolleomyces aberdarensis]|uniref:G domain-containing protein n=1 Tax=Candolleomyces aberdarensis TaxID=2316362 RepID=A0A4Q2DEZ6_9AGAR|nr:hypothetical protein EST38_g8599 [Candolleomyces aberdarensis]